LAPAGGSDNRDDGESTFCDDHAEQRFYKSCLNIDALYISIYDATMRTTIDLDPDLDARLRALARERGVPLRIVINDALRAGTQPGAGDAPPYTLPSRRLGVRPGIDLDKALRLAGELEDDEIVRKLDLRK
jgi:hypothetical protein